MHLIKCRDKKPHSAIQCKFISLSDGYSCIQVHINILVRNYGYAYYIHVPG